MMGQCVLTCAPAPLFSVVFSSPVRRCRSSIIQLLCFCSKFSLPMLNRFFPSTVSLSMKKVQTRIVWGGGFRTGSDCYNRRLCGSPLQGWAFDRGPTPLERAWWVISAPNFQPQFGAKETLSLPNSAQVITMTN